VKPLPAPTPSSIISFSERGPWGNARYPGNSSGFVMLELLAALKPRFVIDVTAGSGTNVELCNDFGIRVLGLDLKGGFNALKESVLGRAGEPADLTWSHPPYWDVKKYSAHPDDLCACANEDEFLGKLHVLLLNQREATRPGGHYATLIGDRRKGGCYSSYQADCITRMPRDELKSVVIKTQHNVSSASKSYALRYPLVAHEYLLVWQRAERSLYALWHNLVTRAHRALEGTWKALVHNVLIQLGAASSLGDIYAVVAEAAPEALTRTHWQAKVRQVLYTHPEVFCSSKRGVWGLTGRA
jgi:hypothetical protein